MNNSIRSATPRPKDNSPQSSKEDAALQRQADRERDPASEPEEEEDAVVEDNDA